MSQQKEINVKIAENMQVLQYENLRTIMDTMLAYHNLREGIIQMNVHVKVFWVVTLCTVVVGYCF
jgi:hypothetical protein